MVKSSKKTGKPSYQKISISGCIMAGGCLIGRQAFGLSHTYIGLHQVAIAL
jgi:hypothetical protein